MNQVSDRMMFYQIIILFLPAFQFIKFFLIYNIIRAYTVYQPFKGKQSPVEISGRLISFHILKITIKQKKAQKNNLENPFLVKKYQIKS
jgi:hypothetical protein